LTDRATDQASGRSTPPIYAKDLANDPFCDKRDAAGAGDTVLDVVRSTS
jgi:hypothetical protein